jgi:SAM-dependent methyltransferase
MMPVVETHFPEIVQPLPIPRGQTERGLHSYLSGFSLDGAPTSELANYLDEDFRRFIYTLGLVPDKPGRLLEIGANPYFTTVLLRRFRRYELSLTNYFGINGGGGTQTLNHTETGESFAFEFLNSNVDVEDIPFEHTFDVVLFCEVIEHLVTDPLEALRRIKAKLAPGGLLVLTTPNVNRLENIAKMLAGQNMYDPISGYGVYGRHNREYNKHELFLMLDHLGFDLEALSSSDVHENHSNLYYPIDSIEPLVRSMPNRVLDLGQYIFLSARNNRPARTGKPRWLYRSYPENAFSE